MDLSLTKQPWYIQVAIFVALSVGGVVAFYYLYAAPVQEEQAKQQTQLSALKTEIQKGAAVAGKLPQFRAQVAELQARLNGLKAVLPEEKDFGDLLRNLQTLAVQSNLTIRLFRPAPVVTKPMHVEWPINIELDGTYHSLGMFFDRVSRFSRIINVGDLHIRAKDKPETNTSIGIACVATTFVLVEPPKAAAAPAGAKQ